MRTSHRPRTPARRRDLTRLRLLLLLGAACALLGGCRAAGSGSARPASAGTDAQPRSASPGSPEEEAASEFLKANRPAYLSAMSRARGWLDGLLVDPLDLRTKGIKGKKKLTEQIDAYYDLWRVAAPEERPPILERIKRVVALTYEDRYHDMASISDQWFKEDATSYLRAAVVMERLGLDTARYREEIEKIHPRLDEQMKSRGPHQRRVFHWYYEHFGLREPFPLESALAQGLIATRRDPLTMSTLDVYNLTHEVLVVHEFGDRLDADPFTDRDREYLRGALQLLNDRYIAEDNPDLVAELVECLHYLRFSDLPSSRAGVLYLMTKQNPDGSWGIYPVQSRRYGDYAKQGFQLHTTLVAIAALTAVFDLPIPPPGPAAPHPDQADR